MQPVLNSSTFIFLITVILCFVAGLVLLSFSRGKTVVAQGPMRTQPGKFTLSGDGLCIGYDSGDAVSGQYKAPGTFKGGTIQLVGVTTEKGPYNQLEAEAEAKRALMAE